MLDPKTLVRHERSLSRFGSFGVRLGDFLAVLPTVGAVLLGVAPFLGRPWRGVFVVSSIVLVLVGIVVSLRQRPRRSELMRDVCEIDKERKREKAEYVKFAQERDAELRDAIKTLARRILSELGIDLTTTRITIYLSHAERNCFIPLARYSRNPDLANPGRSRYDRYDGAIDRAWTKGFVFVDGYPENNEEWVSFMCSQARFPQDVAEAIRMKSRCIAGVQLSHDHHPVGVLIIEADQSWTDATLEDRVQDESGPFAQMCATVSEIVYVLRKSFNNEDVVSHLKA